MKENLLLTEIEQNEFQIWLELNLNSISWEGRYIDDFNSFWRGLFPSDISVADQFDKLEKSMMMSKSGPLISWFSWLKNKLICYLFSKRELTILEISQGSKISLREVSVVLRDFFVERHAHLDEQLSDYFQLSHVTSKKIHYKFSDLSKELDLELVQSGSSEDEILRNLEVTLYKDWGVLNEKISMKNSELEVDIERVKKKTSMKKQVKFLQDLVVLFLIGGIFIAAVKFGNEWYEKKLVKEITLFEPNFFWLDKGINYQAQDPLDAENIKLSYRELEELEKLESKEVFEDNEETARFDVESDVVLTSVNSIPKDFTSADLEQSAYEENRKNGYRNSRYGGRKAYRVMMTSDSPQITKNELVELLEKYDIKQVDNVKPGTSIPGGFYFNLHVPRKFIKEFLSHVTSVKESRILESKTVFGGPKGTNKDFIWIKQI